MIPSDRGEAERDRLRVEERKGRKSSNVHTYT